MFPNIPWDEYVRARAFLTHEEVNVLRRTEEASLDIALGDQAMSRRLVEVLQKVVNLINDAAAQQYALTRIDDILSGKCDLEGGAEATGRKELARRALLFQDADGVVETPGFLRVLRSEGLDVYCKGAAANSLARLLVAAPATPMEPLVAWICDALAASPGGGGGRAAETTEAAVRCLTILLRRNEARRVFAQHGGVGYLTKLLKGAKGGGGGGGGASSSANAQLLYELTFSLWTLSFDEAARPLFLAAGAVPALADQVTAAPREKVVRVSLAALRNLCGEPDEDPAGGGGSGGGDGVAAAVTAVLIGCGLPKTLSNLKDRAWADPDVAGDVEAVYDLVMANYRELSTFERWATEVTTKQLKWGSKLVHCEKFWRENCKELEKHDFALLKALIGLLDSMENEVVAVACYDIGEFVRFYANGKSIVRNLGAKDRIMALIEHDNMEVQREALQCVSKIMVNQWEYVR